MTHPGVTEAACVAVPDPVMGEEVCAFVIPSGSEPPTLEALRAHLVEQGLARFKLPSRLELRSDLPRTASGKVQKTPLRAELQRRRAADERRPTSPRGFAPSSTARLAPRPVDRPVSVLGAGNDDLDAGRRYLAALDGTGLAVPSWPREYGGLGATPAEVALVRRELADFDVPDLYPYLVGLELIGPTLLAHGTPEQCARWLPAIASGDEIWCQLFSEPGAGSDLAGLATRAHADGDEWRVHGQKVWTSRGAYSRYGLLLARHDPTRPETPGHHRVRDRPPHAGRRRAAAPPDERRRALHRSVPRRRDRARRRSHRRRRRRLARRAHLPVVRAGRRDRRIERRPPRRRAPDPARAVARRSRRTRSCATSSRGS